MDQVEQKLLEILKESRECLEAGAKVTFGNTHVSKMKTNCHNINHKIGEILILLGQIKRNEK